MIRIVLKGYPAIWCCSSKKLEDSQDTQLIIDQTYRHDLTFQILINFIISDGEMSLVQVLHDMGTQ